MKKIYYLIFLAIGISGCSVESLDSTEELTTADAKFVIQETKDPMSIYAGPNLKGTVSISHDCDNLYVKLTPTDGAPDDVKLGIFEGTNLPSENGYSGEMQYDITDGVIVGADWVWTFNMEDEAYDTETNLNIFFTAWGGDWVGTLSLGTKKNAPNYQVFNFDFSSLDCDSCEESFSYTSISSGTYTFTYVPAEDIANANLVFTFAQSVEISGLESWSSNGVTKQMNMDLTACEEYSWTVVLLKNCNGSSPNSNVWTDFKVNDVSKKNDNTPNLTESCNN